MLQTTTGIVLRSVKYGETSLVTNIFTREFGVQAYLIQGVRTTKTKQNRAALLQPSTLLELVAYQKQQKSLQRLREFQYAYMHRSLQAEVVKNSIALFSVELLLRLLPEDAPLPDLFDYCFQYFQMLDQLSNEEVANLPVHFIIQISRLLGYEIKGDYSAATPHLHFQEGGFSDHLPVIRPFVTDDDARALAALLTVDEYQKLREVSMNAAMRFRLLDWYIAFLQQHSQHLSQIKSLAVLQAILH